MTDLLLERWLAAALEVAGARSDLDLPRVVDSVLDLARDVAHAVDRPAAPLATFAIGLALGPQATIADIEAAAARVKEAAVGWSSQDGSTD